MNATGGIDANYGKIWFIDWTLMTDKMNATGGIDAINKKI